MSKYLDIFFNQALKKKKEIKRHYLIRTLTGYYFKYGIVQDKYPFLNAIGTLFDLSTNKIKKILIKKLTEDTDDRLYTSLNNGNVKTQFKEK